MAVTVALHNLANFWMDDLLELGKDNRCVGAGCSTVEQAGGNIVRCLYDPLTGTDGARCCKTHPYGALDWKLQAPARSALGDGGDDE